MHKSQPRNTRNRKKKGNITPPKVHKSTITKSKDTEVAEMADKEFKMINALKEESNKQLSEVRKSIQGLDEKIW
jgi:hypothetical protein